jgi:baculoviral IAP repeat-containing protein 6
VADVLAELAEQAAAVLAASAGARGEDDAAALARQVAATAEALASRRRAARLAGGAADAKRRRRAAAAAAAAAGGANAAGAAAAAAASEYEAVMSRQTFDSHALAATHYFRREFPSAGSAAGEAGKVRMRRIVREAAAMRSGLPCAWGSVVAVRVDESRADVMQALIVPHRDTPYAGGVFVFDILLPADYPNSPPRVVILTTGGGRVRFNPNLYADGKVCLSLLGTWKGPGWDAQHSTLLQVLISIQSLIFVERPWFNECVPAAL